MPEKITSEKIIGIEEIRSDPNFIWVLLGGVLWLLGFFTPIIGPLMTTTGFALVCLASSVSALNRPIKNAWPALLAGGIIHLVGQYLVWIPLIGWVLAPFFIVFGSVMIIFFAIPLALQRGEVPVVKDLQKRFETKEEKEKPAATETEADSESSE